MKKVLIYTPYIGVGHFDGWNILLRNYLISFGMQVKFSTDFACTQTQNNDLIRHPELNKFYVNVGVNEAIKIWSPDLVINTFFDSLTANLDDWNLFNKNFQYQWSGIYFRPRVSRELFLQRYYLSNIFFGLQFVVRDDYLEFKKANPNIHAGYLPDTSNSELPITLSPLALRILKMARGRKIIFMGGSIGFRKNVLQWIKLIKIADSEKYYFLQIGKFHYNEFKDRALSIISNFIKNPPNNCTVVEKYFVHERYFNELITISDCIFSVYKDFEASSNMIPKSVIFGVPILVGGSSRVMARDVNRYNLGLVIPSTNAKIILSMLENNFTSFDRMKFINGCFDYKNNRMESELIENLKKFFKK